MAVNPLSYGQGISLQGKPTLATQIALERERRAAARRLAEENRANQLFDQKNKQAKEDFNITVNDLTVKNPEKYHRIFLPQVMKERAELMNRFYEAYSSDPFTARSKMQGDINNYLTRVGQWQQESQKAFDDQNLDSTKFVVDPERQKILRTGTMDDLISYGKVAGPYRSFSVQENEGEVPSFGFEKIPKVDTNKWVQDFSNANNMKENYDFQTATKPYATSGGFSYFRDKAIPRPDKVEASIAANLQDADYIKNLIHDTPIEELQAAGVNLNDPNTIMPWAKGQLDNKALSLRNVQTDDKRVNTPSEPSKSGGLVFGKGGASTPEYQLITTKLPNETIQTRVVPLKGTSETIKTTTWRRPDGSTFDGEFVTIDDSGKAGDVPVIIVQTYPKDTEQKLKLLDNKYSQLVFSPLPSGEERPKDQNGNPDLTPQEYQARLKEQEVILKDVKPKTERIRADAYNKGQFRTYTGGVSYDDYIKQVEPEETPVYTQPAGKDTGEKIKTITSQSEYEALPKGAKFIWNGQTLTKE